MTRLLVATNPLRRLLRASMHACLLACMVACNSDNQSTAPPAPAGPTNPDDDPSSSKPDASRVSTPDAATIDDDDAGTGKLDDALACERVDAAPFRGEDAVPGSFLNATEVPDDYIVTRVSSGFTGTCDEPRVVLAFSGGRCPDGDGHELVIELEVAAIEAARFIGQYALGQVDDGPEPVSIRYRRPENRRPSGEWGTCKDGVSGTLDFASMIGVERRDAYEGMYNLSLPPCDGTTGPTQVVRGTFALSLDVGLATLCGE